jgi:hypothetical protein
MFYLRNLVWRAFARQVGYKADYFGNKYDFALSFAGQNRATAERLYEILTARDVSVFYDQNEQHRILAVNVEEYLAPIYRSEARYVLPLLSKEYPTRIWTKFESDNFRSRFGEEAIIPIRYTDTEPGYFSDDRNYGGLTFDPSGDSEIQLAKLADILCKRIVDDREEAAAAADGEP